MKALITRKVGMTSTDGIVVDGRLIRRGDMSGPKSASTVLQNLNVEMAGLARSEGVRWFSIGSDAHSASELGFLSFGMATAALAGIPRERILNYRSVEFVRSWARAMSAVREGS